MALKNFLLCILYFSSVFPISLCDPNSIMDTMDVLPNSYYFLYENHSLKTSWPGTNFLDSFPSSNMSRSYITHKFITKSCQIAVILIFATSLIIPMIGYLLHFIRYNWIKDGFRRKKGVDVRVFTLDDLKEATSGFSPKSCVVKGDNGTFYRGCFPNGNETAIKRFERTYKKTDASFQMELSILTETRHDNLMNLIGYCSENNEQLLVFEYMTNGSLYERLYTCKFQSDCPLHMWKLRIKILLDCARGIQCLHTHGNRGIIHRNVKASNILLDHNWNARILDLGYAMVGPEPGIGRLYDVPLVGTNGYIDPEYEALKSVTLKSDVYSFGVVMIEMITSKGAYFEDEDSNYVDYIVPKIIKGELAIHLDMRLKEPIGVDKRSVELIGQLAEKCVRRASVLRPTMTEIVREIEYVLSFYD